MSLGTYVVVEWGWSTKSDGERNTAGLSFDQMLGSQCEMAKLIKERQLSSKFNYDAMKGKVSNFSWSVNNVGGFDCSVDIISMGSVLMSTPTKSTSITNGCKDSDDEKEEKEESEKAEELFPNSYAMMVFLYQDQIAGDPFEVPGLSGDAVFAGFPAKFDKDVTEGEKEKDLDTESYNEDLSYYITWDYFEEHIINRALIPEISAKSTDGQTSGGGTEKCCSGKSDDQIQDIEGNETSWNKIYNKTKEFMPHLVDRRRVGVGALDSRGSITKNHPFLISSNPNVCLLPGQCHWDGYEEDTNWASDAVNEYSGIKHAKAQQLDKKSKEAKTWVTKADYWVKSKIETGKSMVSGLAGDLLADDNVATWAIAVLNDSGLKYGMDVKKKNGVLSNMLLNVRFLQTTLSEVETLAEYINKICDSVNEACANYFDLQLIEDPDVPAIMRVVDGEVHDLGDDVIVPKLPAVGQKSICREVGIDTKLSGPIAAEVMYGTSKKQTAHDMGENGTAKWNMWNAEVIDMDHANIAMMNKVEEGVNACSNDEGDLEDKETVEKIKASYIESRKDLADNVAKEQIDACNTAVKKRIEVANTAIVDGVAFDVNSTGVQLPLEIGVTLDGMSGIIWGLPMSVDYLPPRYDNAAFTITKVDHTIDDKGWTLVIETVMRPGIFATTGLEDKTPPPEKNPSEENNTSNSNNNQPDPNVETIPEEETGPATPPEEQTDEEIAEEFEESHDEETHYDVSKMRTSNKMIDMIKKFEGFEEQAYKDAVGVWTIGYGTTEAAMGRPINPGDTISEEDASLYLEMHVNETYEPQVKRYVTSKCTQGEFDAIVSFVYNLGIGSLKKSTLLRKFNANDHKGAANEFKRWTKAGGKVLAGLVKRRNKEATHFRDTSIPKA
jgi:lysozyme